MPNARLERTRGAYRGTLTSQIEAVQRLRELDAAIALAKWAEAEGDQVWRIGQTIRIRHRFNVDVQRTGDETI